MSECNHNYISLEINLPTQGKALFFGVAFDDEEVDYEHVAMWWADTLSRIQQSALQTLGREGVFESVES